MNKQLVCCDAVTAASHTTSGCVSIAELLEAG